MNNCKNCNANFNDNDVKCILCNYPLKGNNKEQAQFIAKQIIQKSDVEDSIEKLKKSRLILFLFGGFNIVATFIPFFNLTNPYQKYFSIGFGLMFIAFGFLTFKIPKTAILIPLVIVSLYYVLITIISPFTFFNGLLWKMIIIMGLGYGYFSVRKSNKILDENKYLASTLGYNKIKNK